MEDRRKPQESQQELQEQQELEQPTRTAVLYEVRYPTLDPCPRCGSRRKTVVPCLGAICTECFDQCKLTAEREVEEGNAAQAIPAAYELALELYLERNLH